MTLQTQAAWFEARKVVMLNIYWFSACAQSKARHDTERYDKGVVSSVSAILQSLILGIGSCAALLIININVFAVSFSVTCVSIFFRNCVYPLKVLAMATTGNGYKNDCRSRGDGNCEQYPRRVQRNRTNARQTN